MKVDTSFPKECWDCPDYMTRACKTCKFMDIIEDMNDENENENYIEALWDEALILNKEFDANFRGDSARGYSEHPLKLL